MQPIRIIFIGTGEIGVELLKSLHQDSRFEIMLVVTGVDKPAGRKMELQPSAIKKTALELGMNLFQPENIKTVEAVEKLKNLTPDIILVMAYGQLLSQEVLDIPKIDCLNVHTSLLPKYRGASPIQSVLLNGEKKTGITLMKMVQKMDSGAIYQQFEINISENETTESLEQKLSELTAERIPESLIDLVEKKLEPIEQNESLVTHVTKIAKSDGLIDWTEPAEVIERKIRAFYPWPGTFTSFKGKRLKIHQAKAHRLETSEKAGKVIQQEGLTGVATGKGILELMVVQLEGKKPQGIKEFLNGNTDFVGSRL